MTANADRLAALEEAVVAAYGIISKPRDGGADRGWVLDNLALEVQEIAGRRPELAQLLADPQPDPVSAGEAEASRVRAFGLDPDSFTEAGCPDCGRHVTIEGHAVFHGRTPDIGTELDHDPVLGDLIDAAAAHKCPEEDGE
jgi:hypothetical protein